MAEKRMLHKRVSISRKVNALSDRAAILWTWAIPWFDVDGYLEVEPDFLKTNIVPRRQNISENDIPGLVDEICEKGLWELYKTKNGKLVAYDPMFKEMQSVRADREAKSQFTSRSLREYSRTTPGVLPPKLKEIKLKEIKLKQVVETLQVPPGDDSSPVDIPPQQKPKDALLEDQKFTEGNNIHRRLLVMNAIIREKFPRFNAEEFYREAVALDLNREAVWEALQRLKEKIQKGEEVANPYAYVRKVMEERSKDLNAQISEEEHTAKKSMFHDLVDKLMQMHGR